MTPSLFSFATLDGFRGLHLFIAVLTFLWAMGYGLSAIRARKAAFLLPALVTLIATLGIFLADSLFTLFACFEVMSMASYLLVIHPATPQARKAGGVYLGVAVSGGLSMLMGLLLLYTSAGTLDFALLPQAVQAMNRGELWAAGLLLLVGFGAKAAMFPLHVWLPGSYTQAPFSGTMILSAALSKAGTFGLLVLACTLFAGDGQWGLLLVLLGTATMVWGGLLAVASGNLKTTLAYSSMSQIGFILVGVGMIGVLGEHNAIAVRGTLLHTLNHSLIKLVLFTVAGEIFRQYGTLELRRLRGAGRGRPMLNIAFLVGGAAIGGVPLLSGYVSKTLLHESIVEYIHLLPNGSALWSSLEMLFLFSGGLTVAYIGKLYYTLFVQKPQGQTAAAIGQRTPLWELLPLLLSLWLVALGALPGMGMDRIADAAQLFLNSHLPAHAVEYFAWVNLKGAVISLTIGAVVFALCFLLLPRLLGGRTSTQDCGEENSTPSLLRHLYLPVLYYFIPLLMMVVARGIDKLCAAPMRWLMNMPEKTEKVYPKLNFSFGNYTQESASQGYFTKYLPASLRYSLLTFSIALLLGVAYLIFF